MLLLNIKHKPCCDGQVAFLSYQVNQNNLADFKYNHLPMSGLLVLVTKLPTEKSTT